VGRPKHTADGRYRWCSGHAEYLSVADFSPTATYCRSCQAYQALRAYHRRQRARGKVPQRWYALGEGDIAWPSSTSS